MKKQYLLLIPAMLCLAGCNNDKDVTAINVSVLPKVTYKSGEKLDLTGLKVEASLSDGSKKNVSTFTTDADTEKTLRVGKEEVKISYSEGEKRFETSFDVTVNTYFHVDYAAAKANYTDPITISPMDGVTIDNTNHIITFAPAVEKTEYEISGYYKGQLKNTVKNTTFKLNNAYIENDNGVSVIYADIKTNVSFASETTSYLVMTGKNDDYKAAYQVNKKNIEIGGSGTGYFVSTDTQVVKGDEIEVKGSGKFYFEGCSEESVINCNTFIVGEEKAFEMFVSNGKNGIKADEGIDISSGTFNFADNGTALKVDVSEDPQNDYKIVIDGGTFKSHLNDNWQSSAENCYEVYNGFEVEVF